MPTELQQHLAQGPPPPRPTPLDAFALARREMRAGRRVEIQAIADELGVSRVTVHRWVGSRDELIAEVAWAVLEPELRRAWSATRTRGGRRVAAAVEATLATMLEGGTARTFTENEPDAALRIFTTNHTTFQERFVAAVGALLAHEADAGRLDPPMDLDDLAYVVVRLGESFTYTNIITGREPDAAKAGKAIAALLR